MAEPNLVPVESDGQSVLMWMPRDDVDKIPEGVWMAALDAKACKDEPGVGEAGYINKERHHMTRARVELDEQYAGNPLVASELPCPRCHKALVGKSKWRLGDDRG